MSRWDALERKEQTGPIGPVPVILCAAPTDYIPPDFERPMPVRPKVDPILPEERAYAKKISPYAIYRRARQRGEPWLT